MVHHLTGPGPSIRRGPADGPAGATGRVIDLRSDIIARPSPAMVDAMAAAAGRRRGYGMREDPEQQELDALAAELLGQEDSLSFPTCTMANQVALQVLCAPGTAIVADADCHVLTAESDSTTAVSRLVPVAVRGERGHLTPEQVEAALVSADHGGAGPITGVVLENTHNRAGGTVMPPGWQDAITAAAARHGAVVHLDGSRIWNAAVHLGRPASDLTGGVTSVSTSLNKGLGVPLGALLAGERAFIAEALRLRDRLGGGWRPTGVMAAAGIVALDTMVERLAEDHARAAALARRLAGLPGLSIDPATVQTNIIMATVAPPLPEPERLVAALAERGVLVLAKPADRIRLVFHSDIREADVPAVADAFESVASITV